MKLNQKSSSYSQFLPAPPQADGVGLLAIEVEGHVSASDIKRLLIEQPDVAGLSVPQMPVGTPGMELGDHKDPFSVLSFNRNGIVAVFSEYTSSSITQR